MCFTSSKQTLGEDWMFHLTNCEQIAYLYMTYIWKRKEEKQSCRHDWRVQSFQGLAPRRPGRVLPGQDSNCRRGHAHAQGSQGKTSGSKANKRLVTSARPFCFLTHTPPPPPTSWRDAPSCTRTSIDRPPKSPAPLLAMASPADSDLSQQEELLREHISRSLVEQLRNSSFDWTVLQSLQNPVLRIEACLEERPTHVLRQSTPGMVVSVCCVSSICVHHPSPN